MIARRRSVGPWHLFGLGAASILAVSSASSASSLGVYNASAVRGFFEAMATRRVSIDCVGDSNMFGVAASGPKLGYFGALGQVLEEKGHQWYGAPCIAPGGGASNLSRWSTNGKNLNHQVTASTPLQWPHSSYLLTGSNANPLSQQYAHTHITVGDTATDTYNIGVRTGFSNPPASFYVVGETYTAHLVYATFSTPTAYDNRFQYRLWTYSPGRTVAQTPLIDPVTGVDGIGFTSVSGPFPEVNNSRLMLGLVDGATGPHVLYYGGITRDSVETGFSQNSVWARGGDGVPNLKNFLVTSSHLGLRLYQRQLVAAQESDHKVLALFMMLGINDRTMDPIAWGDALELALYIYEAEWQQMLIEEGWTGDLYFVLWPGPHTRLEDPENQSAHRKEARAVAGFRRNASVIDLDALGADAAYIMAQPGWVIEEDGVLDVAHLRNDAYIGLVRIGLDALLAEIAQCAGDLNADGFTNITDFTTLATNFGAQDAGYADGDINGDGMVDLADFQILATAFGCTPPSPS
ncbi:MAG: hypothetical protein AAFX05_06305 [Planctomycetota bacterium]